MAKLQYLQNCKNNFSIPKPYFCIIWRLELKRIHTFRRKYQRIIVIFLSRFFILLSYFFSFRWATKSGNIWVNFEWLEAKVFQECVIQVWPSYYGLKYEWIGGTLSRIPNLGLAIWECSSLEFRNPWYAQNFWPPMCVRPVLGKNSDRANSNRRGYILVEDSIPEL